MAIKVGDRVKLTGAFLRNTGQTVSNEGSRVWTARAIDGRFVITDEQYPASYLATMWPDIPAGHPDHDSIKFRRIADSNLQPVKVKT